MKKCSSIKTGLLIATIILLISSIVAPMAIGFNVRKSDKVTIAENYNCYHISEIPNLIEHRISKESNIYNNIDSEKISKPAETMQPLDDPPMDSPWPMYCHDTRHTGRSPYSTAYNTGHEVWWIKLDAFVEGSAVIDNNILYFGSWNNNFYAVDLINRSIIWSYYIGGNIESSPAIDENGIIYVGTAYRTGGNRLYAFYPEGNVKWDFSAGDNIFGSPVIDDDGTIYFGNDIDYPLGGYINALYPNGTVRWRYKTNHLVHSSPAIGPDGTIYCGSHDGNMYALYPNNGTLKWKYHTGDWVARGACIGDDGTIYFGSWDGHLYACYPNGTLKWKTGVYSDTTPVIAEDGTIYVGSDKLSAVNPVDGSVIWQYDVPGRIASGNPCVSADGTIYCGTADNGNIVAVNPDGTLRWKLYYGGESYFAPIIDSDGNVYIGSNHLQRVSGGLIHIGYLHIFGKLEQNAPTAPIIKGPSKGTRNVRYNYTIKSFSPLGNDLYYWIEWGDKVIEEWIGPYKSGEEVEVSHSWGLYGDYLIRVKVKDVDDIWGPWSTFEVKIQKNRAILSSLLMMLIHQFPILKQLSKEFL